MLKTILSIVIAFFIIVMILYVAGTNNRVEQDMELICSVNADLC